MQKMNKYIDKYIPDKIKPLIRSKYFLFALVLCVYFFTTVYYMGPAITSCSDNLYGFGDNTSGPIWRSSVTGNSILGGFTTISNYPAGENLYSPVNWVSLVQSVMYWLFANIAGPVCGYNLYNIIGFLFSSILMFYFVRWLTKNNYVAWLAGYLIAFSPYMQVKVGGHPNTAFSGMFVALIWLTVRLVNKPTPKRAIALGVVYAINLYLDPYFVLYSTLTLLAAGLGYLLFLKDKTLIIDAVNRLWRSLVIVFATFLVVASPFLVNYVANSTAIQSQVASQRGDVVAEAYACSNYPYEYLLPFALHPLSRVLHVDATYKLIEDSLKNHFSCGIGEDSVGISLTLIFIIFAGLLIYIWDKLNKRKTENLLDKEMRLVLVMAVTLLCIGLLFGLPPTKYMGIPTPSLILLHITTTWRTMTRVYMLVNVAAIIIGSVLMHVLASNKKISRRFKTIFFVVVAIFMFVEYQAFDPFKGNQMSGFSYSTNTPDIYKYLKNDTSIKSIVEYPLESYGESDAPSYYLSMQYYHKKNILNSPTPKSSLEDFRRSIKNIADPQSIPALSALGIDAAVVHGVDESVLKALSGYKMSSIFNRPTFTLLAHTSIIPSDQSLVLYIPKNITSAYIGLLHSGFYRNLGIIHGVADWEYEAVNGAEIYIRNIHNGIIDINKTPVDYCFDIRTDGVQLPSSLDLSVDGIDTPLGSIDNKYRSVHIKATSKIIINTTSKVNTQVKALGCANY